MITDVLASTVVGVDVGAPRKGLHGVALCGTRFIDKHSTPDPLEMAAWCRHIEARAVGVDSPCFWSPTGRARTAERELMQCKIQCFSTPSQLAAECHPTNHFGWMVAGASLYKSLASEFELYRGDPSTIARPFCFETFPHAIACALAGTVVSAKKKSQLRRKLLSDAGVDTAPLTNIDLVDAALCALTASSMLSGNFRCYGEATTGLIVVPSAKYG